jgi:hypothetical protein
MAKVKLQSASGAKGNINWKKLGCKGKCRCCGGKKLETPYRIVSVIPRTWKPLEASRT